MTKIKLAIIFFLITSVSFGQQSKISVGLIGSPDLYNYKFSDTIEYILAYKYQAKMNYSLGVDFQYNINKRFGIKADFCYSSKSFFQNYKWLIQIVDPFNVGIPKYSLIKLAYLDIPLLFTYNIQLNNRFYFQFQIGTNIGVLLNEKETLFRENGTKTENDSFFTKKVHTNASNILYNGEFKIGTLYNINSKLFISFEPYFRYGFNKIYNCSSSKNPISYGLIAGLHYKIK